MNLQFIMKKCTEVQTDAASKAELMGTAREEMARMYVQMALEGRREALLQYVANNVNKYIRLMNGIKRNYRTHIVDKRDKKYAQI